ncbi:hemolysin III family protein [Parabacteroides sp. PF5-9]|uniref:PAQR family membrane homeostasis protein TrhA n=1 Tax=Parabacteroides sp. PF5-9 TaxID=1742404 RepID=UPI002476E092|nr:hemolysin III family protein [Parabacteroides sp. PF5-9]MDH6358831.1 hemolysin III [Parabacteroides sp. PF5-9]
MPTGRQTRQEEIANVITHGVGMVFGLTVLILLILKAVGTHNAWVLFSFTVYALCMTLSYVTSTYYHAATNGRRKHLLRKFDHSAIYLHIAGTYTPFTLITLRQEGFWGWGLFLVIWLAAVVGVFLSFRKIRKSSTLKTICYLLMGWVVVIAFKPLLDVLQRTDSMAILYWLIAGGLFYSLGTIFFVLDKYKYMHTVWHLFVLGGTVCHFISVWLLV